MCLHLFTLLQLHEKDISIESEGIKSIFRGKKFAATKQSHSMCILQNIRTYIQKYKRNTYIKPLNIAQDVNLSRPITMNTKEEEEKKNERKIKQECFAPIGNALLNLCTRYSTRVVGTLIVIIAYTDITNT